MYAKGQGVKRDPKEAVNWWRKAAEKGETSAQANLASYAKGQGIARDEEDKKMLAGSAATPKGVFFTDQKGAVTVEIIRL
mgnify:CR=1 FL=1